MTLEEQKKLVAEKFGFEVKGDLIGHPRIHVRWNYDGYPSFSLQWKPHEERKWWDEIWDKMDEFTFNKYMRILTESFGIVFRIGYREIHTAKPEIMWKALIKTLKEK